MRQPKGRLHLFISNLNYFAMGDVNRTLQVKEEISRRVEEKFLKEQLFLKLYDETLNKYLLHVFWKKHDYLEKAHDHRALQVLSGEVLRLRLDAPNGQAEGIRVDADNGDLLMYIWFNPDMESQSIVFRIAFGGDFRISEVDRYKLQEIEENFLSEFIAHKLLSVTIPLN